MYPPENLRLISKMMGCYESNMAILGMLNFTGVKVWQTYITYKISYHIISNIVSYQSKYHQYLSLEDFIISPGKTTDCNRHVLDNLIKWMRCWHWVLGVSSLASVASLWIDHINCFSWELKCVKSVPLQRMTSKIDMENHGMSQWGLNQSLWESWHGLSV